MEARSRTISEIITGTSSTTLTARFSNVGQGHAALESWGHSPATLLKDSSSNSSAHQGSDSSEDHTPDSTFSASETTRSRVQSPASSVCVQEHADEEPCASLDEVEHHAAPEPSVTVDAMLNCSPPRSESTPLATGSSEEQPQASDSILRNTRSLSIISRFLQHTRGHAEPSRPQAAQQHIPPAPAASVDAVIVPVPSEDKMYPFRGAPGLYVAFEDQIPPPSQKAQRWKTYIQPRFWTDASEFQRKVMKTKIGQRYPPGISIELRMSGYASSPSSAHVELFPRIWVLYDHNRWKKETKQFVSELEWLEHEGFGPVEIRKGSPRLATLNPPLSVDGLSLDPGHGFALNGGAELFLHVEHRLATSAIGLLCCATVTRNGAVRGQRVSRIGGLVSIDSTRTLAITTAHGMLELALDAFRESELEAEEAADSAGSPLTDDGYESDESSDSDNAAWVEATWPTSTTSFGPERVRRWEPVEVLGVTSFLGSAHLDMGLCVPLRTGPRSQQKGDSDFSLWRIPRADSLGNDYEVWEESGLEFRVVSERPAPDTVGSLNALDVDMLLGPSWDQSVRAHLLPGESQFMVHGVHFTGRKIRTKAPLGMLSTEFSALSNLGSFIGLR